MTLAHHKVFAPCKQFCFSPLRMSVDCSTKFKLLAPGIMQVGGMVCICMVQLPHANCNNTQQRYGAGASEKAYFYINFFSQRHYFAQK